MNKDNVRKYIADIQIAMGKILEEMQGFEEVAKTLIDHDNLDEDTVKLTDGLGISQKEVSAITDALKNTKPKTEPEYDELNEGLTEDEISERNVHFEMGVPWKDPRVKQG